MEMGGSVSLNILIHIWNQVHVHTYIIVCEKKKVNKTKCLDKLFRYIQIYIYKLVHFIEINIYLDNDDDGDNDDEPMTPSKSESD